MMGVIFFQHPVEWILIYVFLVLSYGLHEAAHAKVAGLFGDTQPRDDGIDTWNPVPHLRRSLFSAVIIPALTWFAFNFFIGGAFTRLNPENMKPRRLGHALAIAAGPLTNLALAVLAGLCAVLFAWITKKSDSASVLVAVLVGSFNFFGFTFNLLPVPPLDGAGFLRAVFPRSEGFFRTLQGFPILLIFIISMQFPAAFSIINFPVKLYTNAVADLLKALGL